MLTNLITAADMFSEEKYGACYDKKLIDTLYATPLTLLEVLTKKDTPEWEAVSVYDRFWVAENKLSWTPEGKAALTEALKIRCAEFKADAAAKEKAEKRKITGRPSYTYPERVQRYEEVLNKEHKDTEVYSLLSHDKTCQSYKYQDEHPAPDRTRELVDFLIKFLTPKETPCPIPTATGPQTVPTTTQPETPVSDTTPQDSSKPVKPKKTPAKKPASGKKSAPASARAKKPS